MEEKLKLYARSKNFLWTDEHIAGNMLNSHLDDTSDAASRNSRTIDQTVDWINGEIPAKSKIIDFGCGPGLYTERFAAKGHSVTGIDISENTISYALKSADKKGLTINYIAGNYLSNAFNVRADVALCIYCDFGALIPSEQSHFLKKVYNSLPVDGTLIFDVFTEELGNKGKETKSWTYNPEEGFWCRNPHYVLSESVHFQNEHCWGNRTIILDAKTCEEKEFITWDLYYTDEEIKTLLSDNGFKLKKIEKGLVLQNDFTSNDVMFVKARKN